MRNLIILLATLCPVTAFGQDESLPIKLDRRMTVSNKKISHHFPPVRRIQKKTQIVEGWWDNAYHRLKSAADRRTDGFDANFEIHTKGGFGNGGESSIGATLSFPIFSKKERLAKRDDRQKFMEKGLALIREAREIAKLIQTKKGNILVLKAMLQSEGASGFKALSLAEEGLIKNEERSSELESIFNELVRVD